ncbi:MAG: GNAT family N-acetyltransferase, partial [Thermoplasmata archaeon]|nr:GNAT family N-acetyltransferase [Thermoplasmata archaeon]
MGRTDTIVPADTAPTEALRLLDEFERGLDPDSPLIAWNRLDLATHRAAIRAGHLDGGVWVGPKDEAVALAVWSSHSGAGRRVVPYLGEGYRTGAALAAFVRALDASGPIRLVAGPIPGLGDAQVTEVLAPLGFQAVERADLVFPDGAPVPPLEDSVELAVRPLDAADRPRIARLLERAYSDTPVDRWLFAQSLDAARDADAAADDLLGDGVGRWRPDASFGIEIEGRLVAATLVNELLGALLSEVMVDPAWRRRGLARRLIARSIAAVRSLGLGPLRLVVTVGNDRAEPL